MAFPDDRDRVLQKDAENVFELADSLIEWLNEVKPARQAQSLGEIGDEDELQLIQLRREALELHASSRVPVAAAVYGPSQVGKSLFVGSVLRPLNEVDSPLGRDALGEPAYYRSLSFDNDINPQCGSNEATALVTRFSTKDRVVESSTSANYPVVARALTRAQWLRVLARGFFVECKLRESPWELSQLEAALRTLHDARPGDPTERKARRWRLDLLDAYHYMKRCDSRGFPAGEAQFAGLLNQYPLEAEAYVDLAAKLFWNNWSSLTQVFNKVSAFLDRLRGTDEDRSPVLFCHWAAVRFLLDSQRKPFHENPDSRCFRRVDVDNLCFIERGGQGGEREFVLEYQTEPSRRRMEFDLDVIQAALLELVIPVLPHFLTDDWRKVMEQFDLLDIPGMKAGRTGSEQGKRDGADSPEEQWEIVKRGKVAYLFDCYIDELQIQTLLLLVRGGNLEVSGIMKANVSQWGKTRFGSNWPKAMTDQTPALLIGMTGIDEEFRNRNPDAGLYDARLKNLVGTLGEETMNNYGGRDKRFTSVFPLRYPGTWDCDKDDRQSAGPEKWITARQIFLESKLVREYIAAPDQRWDAAMDDHHGGLALIATAFRECTNSVKKQDQLQSQLKEKCAQLLQIARNWVVRADANRDRNERLALAKNVLDWLTVDSQYIYVRAHAISQALCIRDGDQYTLADLAVARAGAPRPEDPANRFRKRLNEFLNEWAVQIAPNRWQQQLRIADGELGTPLLDHVLFGKLTLYLKDYLTSTAVFEEMSKKLLKVVGMQLRNEEAARQARRKYLRLILNDYVMNPGPDQQPLRTAAGEDEQQFGLMAPLIRRWLGQLPLVLADGAGRETRIPAGNDRLINLLAPYSTESV